MEKKKLTQGIWSYIKTENTEADVILFIWKEGDAFFLTKSYRWKEWLENGRCLAGSEKATPPKEALVAAGELVSWE